MKGERARWPLEKLWAIVVLMPGGSFMVGCCGVAAYGKPSTAATGAVAGYDSTYVCSRVDLIRLG